MAELFGVDMDALMQLASKGAILRGCEDKRMRKELNALLDLFYHYDIPAFKAVSLLSDMGRLLEQCREEEDDEY